MTIRPHSLAPCWEIIDERTGRPPRWDCGEGSPHYPDWVEALFALVHDYKLDDDELDDRPQLATRQAHALPCIGVFCDGCGEVVDPDDEGWTHLTPVSSHSPRIDLDGFELIESADGTHHWHEDCYPGEVCPNNGYHPHEHGDAGACVHCGHPLVERRIPVGPGQLCLDGLFGSADDQVAVATSEVA